MGPEVRRAGRRRAARAVGGARRRVLRARPSASPSSAAPRTPAAERRSETDRFSLAAMFALAALCLLAGILPGFVIDALAPAVHGLVGARMPRAGRIAWLSIVPIAESRSSYNGLLVFVFIALSAMLAAFAIHRFASRRAPPRPGLGLRLSRSEPGDAIHRRQLRPADPPRVRHASCSARASTVEMPPPGDPRPARFDVELRDLVWDCALRAGRARRRSSRPTGSTVCSS